MNLRFAYDEDKDIDCLLSYGGGSQNSPKKTKTYEDLLAYTDDLSNTEKIRSFIREHIAEKALNLPAITAQLQKNWDVIGKTYEERAENIFGIVIPETITAYITIAGRYPYNLDKYYFFVSPSEEETNRIAMHELLHFYTWEVFKGYVQQGKLSEAKYNDIKESLTVLLNIEFPDLQGGDTDLGYPQHAELRTKVAALWNEYRDIRKVFENLVQE